MLISTKTFIARIVIMTDATPPPTAATFDTKMVIALSRQLTISCTTFQQSLRQRDTSGNLMKFHLFNSQLAILVYIFYIAGIPPLRLHPYGKEENYG